MINYKSILYNGVDDSFATSLLMEIANKCVCDSFYYDANDIISVLNEKIIHDVVVIMIRDQFEFENGFNYWSNNTCTTVEVIKKLGKIYPNKKFIILIEFEIEEVLNHDNIFFINFGGKVVDDPSYQTANIFQKNLLSEKVGISLNRQMRPQRIALISFLYGLGLDKNIHISAMHLHKQLYKINSNDILDHLNWRFDKNHEFIKKIMARGLETIFNKRDDFKIDEIYEMNGEAIIKLDNFNNFNNNLINLYKDSFVEIVSESWFCEPFPFVTEKFQNSVYGRNFPIILSSSRYVEYLRKIGFDVFDDIIDHSYDTIQHPIERLQAAIIKNKHLFIKKENTIDLWINNEHRFNKNIEFARKNMYTYFHERVILKCKSILCNQMI